MGDQAEQGLFSPWLRKQRLQAALPYVRGKVLDYGCGTGSLASMVKAPDYIGYDVDPVSIEKARRLHPEHAFTSTPPAQPEFDSVVSLAVIEHMADPRAFLSQLSSLCKPGGNIVVTTPNPILDPVHHWGSKLGLFSHDASEEHISLLNRKALTQLATSLELGIVRYSRFLMGANQLLVLQR